jgi:formylglycine-generating enzyme
VGEAGRAEATALWHSETQHKVRLSDFSMCRYAVTVAEFRRFVEASGYRTDADKAGFSFILFNDEVERADGVNWRYGESGSVRAQSEANHPVLHVGWNDAVAYCKWLSAKTGKNFRLPTEAEREYACRAGTITTFNTGTKITNQQANFIDDQNQFRSGTVSVDSFAPNALGLYNMHGNVLEWCSDWYDVNYYNDCKAKGTVTNPLGPATGLSRVLRGGSWDDHVEDCRSASRGSSSPGDRNYFIGFRVVFVP